MEKKWWHSAVVYQIYPRSFMDANGDGIGDLQGLISKLDYLERLGVNVLWLSPVYASPMDDNGYDISDYRAIAPEFGTMADMDQLIAESNKRQIKIIMDLVVNHTSDEHPWFKEAVKSKDNPYRDYYIFRDPKADGTVPNDIGSCFSGPAWTLSEATGQYYFHLFSKRQPDLNWENPKVIQEVHDLMNWWLDKGIGGFRMDVIDLIGKEIDKGIVGNGPRLHELLQDMNQATFGSRDVMTVGETWGATPDIAKLYSNPSRKELSMVFQFEHVTAFHDATFGKWQAQPMNFQVIKAILAKWQSELADDGWNSLFWNNHDLPRAVSKYGNDGLYREASAKMLATLLHGLKGTPYIFQGEEIGMTNVHFESLSDYQDLEIHNAYKDLVQERQALTHEEMMQGIWSDGRDNARTPMQWSAEAHAGFTSGEPWIKVNPNYQAINVEHALSDTDSIFYHYKRLIDLRKTEPTLVYGSFEWLCPAHPSCFIYSRHFEGATALMLANHTAENALVELPQDYWSATWTVLIHSGPEQTRRAGDPLDGTQLKSLVLPPYAAMMLKKI